MRRSIHAREYEFVLKKLVDMRRRAGLTQRDLAARLEREPSFVWRIEKGERRLDALEFYWVCHALGAKPEAVYSDLCASFRSCEYPLPQSAPLRAARPRLRKVAGSPAAYDASRRSPRPTAKTET